VEHTLIIENLSMGPINLEGIELRYKADPEATVAFLKNAQLGALRHLDVDGDYEIEVKVSRLDAPIGTIRNMTWSEKGTARESSAMIDMLLTVGEDIAKQLGIEYTDEQDMLNKLVAALTEEIFGSQQGQDELEPMLEYVDNIISMDAFRSQAPFSRMKN